MLSVEPYGMKRTDDIGDFVCIRQLSVLSVEPYGMKQWRFGCWPGFDGLSVLSVEPYGMKPRRLSSTTSMMSGLSVLSVEPYGMKRHHLGHRLWRGLAFSALGRAVWDET